MFKRCTKIMILISLAILVTGCGPGDAVAMTEPTQTDSPPIKEEVPTEVPKTDPLPTQASTKEPLPTEISKSEPEQSSNTWKKIFGGSGSDTLQRVIMSEDGGYLMVGSTNLNFDGVMTGDIYLIKTNENGEILWEETYSNGGYFHGQTIYQTSEGLMVSGVTSSADTQGEDIFVLQLDEDRTEAWIKTFGGPLNEFAAAWPLDDGGYLLGGNIVDPNVFVTDPGAAGYGGFEGRSNVYIAKVDADDNELWSQSFGGDNNVIASAAAMTNDGGFIVMANIVYFPETGDDILLLKVDADGNEIWSRTWDKGNLNGFDLIQTSDGNYLIAGANSLGDDPARSETDYIFIKVDPDGNEIWSTTFGEPEMIEYSMVILETPDGGYLGAGEYTKDMLGSPSDISLVKLDVDGNVIWENKIKMGAHNMFGNMLLHPDGGFVIGGSTVNRGQFDIFLIKMDAKGNIE